LTGLESGLDQRLRTDRGTDTESVELRVSVWLFQLGIPTAIHQHFGNATVLTESSGTPDLRLVRAERDRLLPELRQRFAVPAAA
jgi:hypothetical protein